MKMEPAAAWTATITTSIHEEKSKGSRKAVAEMIPVLLETRIVIPVSRNGTEKSTTDSLICSKMAILFFRVRQMKNQTVNMGSNCDLDLELV